MYSTQIEKVINLNEDQIYVIRSDDKNNYWTIYAGMLVNNIPRVVQIIKGEKTYEAFLKKAKYTESGDRLEITYKTDWYATHRITKKEA